MPPQATPRPSDPAGFFVPGWDRGELGSMKRVIARIRNRGYPKINECRGRGSRNDGSPFATGVCIMKKILSGAVFAVAVLSLVGPANAAVVNSLSGATSVVMPAFNSFTAGPTVFGPITFTSSTSDSVIGFTGGYGLAGNGVISGNPPFAGLNTDVGSMTFTFSAAVSGVLADTNWAISGFSRGLPITASIFDSGNALLETITFSNDGTLNDLAPGYWGFSRGSADIASLTLSNGFIIARDFSVLAEPNGAVPEPASWALMIAGFGLVGSAMRRRRETVRVSFG